MAFVTLGIILVGSVYKTLALHQGGRALAALLGGRELQPNAADSGANASCSTWSRRWRWPPGCRCPPFFCSSKEESINAFAAGFSPAEAVIGVTCGAVAQLSRDELQGVIAHEFSHIVNGDMKLNLRLVGLVHGILVIA